MTTVVFGNCGVTFAPCWQDDHDFLIELMDPFPERRLGGQTKSTREGGGTVRAHPFFKDVNWAAVEAVFFF